LNAGLRSARGFTMVELVTVMVLIGVLAAIGVPRLIGDNGFAAATFGDEVASALRSAQKTAMARRRLACAVTGGQAVNLGLASAPRAAGCDITLGAASTGAAGVAVSSHTMYFQPNGAITSDAAGRNPLRGSIVISLHGQARRSIAFEGSTGHVQ